MINMFGRHRKSKNPKPSGGRRSGGRHSGGGGWPKWAGLVLSVLLAVVWIGSCWCPSAISTPKNPPLMQFGLSAFRGSAHATLVKSDISTEYTNGGFAFKYSGLQPMILWGHAGYASWPREGVSIIIFPLWLPLLLVAIPTGWLWWRDRPSRRFFKNRCPNPRCRYLLTGLTSPKCPECGTEVSLKPPPESSE